MISSSAVAYPKHSGLCFDPYNHDYDIMTRNVLDASKIYSYDGEIILHDGKLQLGTSNISPELILIRYVVKGNKSLILMLVRDKGGIPEYLVFYVSCVNGKPLTKDVENIGYHIAVNTLIADLPKYPIKLGFYRDGFWVKALHVTKLHNDPNYYCNYKTTYYPYKLIEKHEINHLPYKIENVSVRVCNASVNQAVKQWFWY
jgi:hypothetical protein